MIDVKDIQSLVNIADRAVKLHAAEVARKEAKNRLGAACMDWKDENDIEYVARDTPEWEAMAEATTPAFKELERAKSRERHARTSLNNAIIKAGLVGANAS